MHALAAVSAAALSPLAMVSAWQPAPIVDAALILALLGYLYLAWRVRRLHPVRPWPTRRTVVFVVGLAVIGVATQSVVAADEDVLFSAHMVQHVLLIMVAPPLLVCGRPVTLLLHGAGHRMHRRAIGILRSATIRALTWPISVTMCYIVVVAGTHTPAAMDLVLRSEAGHNAEHALYLAAGYLFFLPVVGSEPLPRRTSVIGRYVMLTIAMQADTAVGVLLSVQGREVFAGYATERPAPGISRLADLHLGGIVMWIGSDIVMVVVALAIAVSLVVRRSRVRSQEADGARLADHNAAIERLCARLDAPAGLRLAAVDGRPRHHLACDLADRSLVPQISLVDASADEGGHGQDGDPPAKG